MNLITRNNYEAYLLDYVEGNLSLELIAELMLFLENNSDLKEKWEGFEIHELIPIQVAKIDKKFLKREENFITFVNYEEYIIQEIEGDNSNEVSKELNSFLESNPEKQADYIAYKKTKLIASLVLFDNKKSLKRKEGKVIPIYWWYSSAAAVIIILFLLKGFIGGENQNDNLIADKEEVIKSQQKNENFIDEDQVEEEILPKKDIKLADVELNKPSPIQKRKKESKEKTPKVIPYQKEETPKLIAEQPTEVLKIEENDSLDKETLKLPKEEILYADDVRIVYEDEVVNDTNASTINKVTKFDVVRAMIKHQVKENFLDKGKEKLIFAFNSKPLNFLKRKKKNQ
ncbi:MAG: hypothetical protein COA97_09060 [Flavobacteriales bacterium]|nr:MAG: hypothetical protein COA97_09060 [Flavobacteriales bacterium]